MSRAPFVGPGEACRVLADVETALRGSLPPVALAEAAGPVVVQGGRR